MWCCDHEFKVQYYSREGHEIIAKPTIYRPQKFGHSSKKINSPRCPREGTCRSVIDDIQFEAGTKQHAMAFQRWKILPRYVRYACEADEFQNHAENFFHARQDYHYVYFYYYGDYSAQKCNQKGGIGVGKPVIVIYSILHHIQATPDILFHVYMHHHRSHIPSRHHIHGRGNPNLKGSVQLYEFLYENHHQNLEQMHYKAILKAVRSLGARQVDRLFLSFRVPFVKIVFFEKYQKAHWGGITA